MKELRLSIGAVLRKHGIDDLALECELETVVRGFFTEIGKGRDAEAVKREIETAFLLGQEANRGKEFISSYVKDKLHINPTGPELEARWGRFYEYAYTREQHKEKIEIFIMWWLAHNPDPTYWSPERMTTMWPQAFKNKESETQPDIWEDKGQWVTHL
jgi:hypothetical protein